MSDLRKIACVMCAVSSMWQTVYAQPAGNDSLRVYRKIENFSNRNSAYRFIYGIFFRKLPSEKKIQVSPSRTTLQADHWYTSFQGKIIRNIHITTYDPFGYDHRDTTRKPVSILEKAGNALHVRTMNSTIRQLLIIKKNEPFDSLRVLESERLIRSQSYVHDVVFHPVLTGTNSDSVDIYIRSYDLWGIIVNADLSPSGYKLDIKDKSFLGLGHVFQNKYTRKYNSGIEFYQALYTVSNIKNTYISATGSFDLDDRMNYNRSIGLERPFFSAYSKWAGGTYFLQHFHHTLMYRADSTAFDQNIRFNLQDHWLGQSYQIQKGSGENARTTQLVVAARVMDVNYLERPPDAYDTLRLLADERFYYLGSSVSRRKYERDSYIFRYGNVEDVPVGKAFSLTGGLQRKNSLDRFYVGIGIRGGRYFRAGYLSGNVGYGTFLHRAVAEEGVVSAGFNYFTNILKIHHWKIRQFIKSQYTLGFSRPAADNLTIGSELGKGFGTLQANSTQKVILTLQTQSYAPWNLIGFRFGPYLVTSFGMLGTETSGFRHSPVYAEYGIGLLIRNEYLIYQSLQISIAFYPFIPTIGSNVLRTNPVKTTDFGLQDFSISKPSVIPYQ